MGGMRGWRWAAGLVVAGLAGMPSAWAADVEAAAVPGASVEASDESPHAQILQAIDAETDPELKALMQEELSRLESGELSLQDLELGAPPSTGEEAGTGRPQTLADALLRQGSPGLPADGGGTPGDYLPPGAKQELEALFSQGTGDPNSPADQALREEAEKILEKYGVDPREFGPGPGGDHERGGGGRGWSDADGDHLDDRSGSVLDGIGRGGYEGRGPEDVGFERAFEQMPAEAREQMERFMNERETPGHETSREGMERETGGPGSEREHSYEAPTREYEAPMIERSYEAPTHEYEAPTHENEAPTHEYEAPTYEAPTHEYEAPTGPGDGSGIGPH